MGKRKQVEINWNKQQRKAFDKIKTILTSECHYYDEEKLLIVQCDASQRGLRAALLEEGKPIAYTSRVMTNTEANYGQIEKEHLVIVFAMEKFHGEN